MNYHKGFAVVTTLLVMFGIALLGGIGYVAVNPQVLQEFSTTAVPKDDGVQNADAGVSIMWRFASAGEVNAMPYTKVFVTVNGQTHDMGTFVGSCSEIGASGGIDGKGLLAGELSAAQCWFAGGGNEIGVFAHEDGGVEIMVGELSEGEEGSGLFRGDFSIKNTIRF